MMRAPAYVLALLTYLKEELDRIMWNLNQEEYDSPFANSGNVVGFKTDVFEVHAYDWGRDLDDSAETVPNFKCGDIEIFWYKWYGRGAWINRRVSHDEMIKMFNKCLLSLYQFEYEQDSLMRSAPTMELIEEDDAHPES